MEVILHRKFVVGKNRKPAARAHSYQLQREGREKTPTIKVQWQYATSNRESPHVNSFPHYARHSHRFESLGQSLPMTCAIATPATSNYV